MSLLFAVAIAASATWPTYSNARFGYALCYPSTILRPLPEADNGDGRKFVSKDGSLLFVFGQWNPDNTDLSVWAADLVETYTGKRGRVSYRVIRANWIVLSGIDRNGFAFYSKTIKQVDEFVTFQIRYPVGRSRIYRPIVNRLSRCLTLRAPSQ